jgi:hypothetical protein
MHSALVLIYRYRLNLIRINDPALSNFSDQKGHWDQVVYTIQDKQEKEHDP